MKRATFILCIIFLLCASLVWAVDVEEFPVKSVRFEHIEDMTMVQGEITNNSGKSYETALFKMSFYDDAGDLLGAADIAIMNFKEGETVTFDGISMQDLSGAKTHKIRLEMSA